jgi:hypothetical protein
VVSYSPPVFITLSCPLEDLTASYFLRLVQIALHPGVWRFDPTAHCLAHAGSIPPPTSDAWPFDLTAD